jgi:hypothetical protein
LRNWCCDGLDYWRRLVFDLLGNSGLLCHFLGGCLLGCLLRRLLGVVAFCLRSSLLGSCLLRRLLHRLRFLRLHVANQTVTLCAQTHSVGVRFDDRR